MEVGAHRDGGGRVVVVDPVVRDGDGGVAGEPNRGGEKGGEREDGAHAAESAVGCVPTERRVVGLL